MRIGRLAWLAVALLAGCGDAQRNDAASSGPTGGSGGTAGAGGGCQHACEEGDGRCDGAVPERCVAGADGCRAWVADAACGDGTHCKAGACAGCVGAPGTFSDQSLVVGGETRRYFLYVPASYACGTPAPLLIDFHGTAVGAESDTVEEYYALDGMVEVADAEGFVVARPRSRSAEFDGDLRAFQWDINPGDLDLNVDFAHALVDDLGTRYDLDPARTYASGFSNGTNMAVQFLSDDPPVFAGYAVMAGGVWTDPSPPDLSAAPPRIFATTGYRDYMFKWQRRLVDVLADRDLGGAGLRVRESDTGHELYGWHFAEAFAWLDRGEAPPAGELGAGWTSEGIATSGSLLQLARAGGAVIASSTAGELWRRDPTTSAWSPVGSVTAPKGGSLVTDVCVSASGHGIAIGEGAVALTDDSGASWKAAAPVPEFIDMGFGFSYLNGVSCGASRFVGGGYWAAAVSEDHGSSWSAASMQNESGYSAQVAAIVENATTGTSVAVGYYDYVGRSTDQTSFDPVVTPVDREWFTDVAAGPAGRFWIVGERGTILASVDDGKSWAAQVSGTNEDLYAVDFLDADRGVAAGAHGVVLITSDGGQTWEDFSTGLDHFVGDAMWLDASTLLAVGGGGTVLRALFAEPAGAR